MFRVVLATLLSATFLLPVANAKEVNISGSTSVSRIMDVLAEEFNATHDASYIAVQSIGSTAGITMVNKGVAEIGMSSRYLTEGEYSEQFTVLTIAYDGLGVVVNHANLIKDITRGQLFDVYKGNITNWKQLGGKDLTIAVVTRELSSGSRSSFESLLGLTRIVNNHQVSDISPTNLVVSSNSMVKTIVKHNPQAIGFISDGSVDNTVKELTFEGITATQTNIRDKKYQLSRPFIIFYKTEEISKDGEAFIQFLKSDRAKKLIQQIRLYTNERLTKTSLKI